METTRIDRGSKRKAARTAAPAGKGGAKRVTAGSQPSRPFVQRLMAAQSVAIRKELDELFDKIDAQTQEIEKSLTFESLSAYKELVRKFVNLVVHELYKVEETVSVSPSGRTKSLLLVKKIDETLDELSEKFMNRQTNMIAFMSRLDDIRGLLLDLYS